MKVSFFIEETTFLHALTAFKGALILILRIIFYNNTQYGDFTSIPSGEAECLCKENPFEEIRNRRDVNDEVMIKIVERREARKGGNLPTQVNKFDTGSDRI